MKATFKDWKVQQFEYPTIGGQIIETSCSISLLENLDDEGNCNIHIECWPGSLKDKDTFTVEVTEDSTGDFKCINRGSVCTGENQSCYFGTLRKNAVGKNPYTEIHFFVKEDLFRVGKKYFIELN